MLLSETKSPLLIEVSASDSLAVPGRLSGPIIFLYLARHGAAGKRLFNVVMWRRFFCFWSNLRVPPCVSSLSIPHLRDLHGDVSASTSCNCFSPPALSVFA